MEDTIIIPNVKVSSEEDFDRLLELALLEMRHSAARMDERSERIERSLARMEARDKQFQELLKHVQTPL